MGQTDVLVAGKLYADPAAVKRRLLSIIESSVPTLIFAQTRDELFKLYTTSILSGMHFKVSAIPQDFPTPSSSTEFKPPEMTALFEEGVRQALAGHWRTSPAGAGEGETLIQRSSTRLTYRPRATVSAPHISPGIPAPVNPVTK